MKRLFVLLVSLLFNTTIWSQQYKPVDSLSDITFTIRNFGINVGGSFKGLTGKINFSKSGLANSAFNVSLKAETINTGIDLRDNHLKKSDYFDVKKYPVITFISTKISPNADETGSYTIFGRLTLKGVTKEISFPFNITEQSNGLLFTGTFKINRREYNVGGGTSVLSNSVEVNLKVFAIKN